MKNTIRIQRAIKEITQEQLAEALGVARITINAVELKKYAPSALLAMRMARFFNVNMEELFILEESDLNFKEIKEKE